ncbi:hypothetical protein BH11MYX1_BH11MYX1_36590 [soil metagenome]
MARVVDGALTAAGVSVDHRDEIPADLADAALLVVDRATRLAAGHGLRSASVPVVVVGDDLDDDGLITLMLEAPVSHLVGDPSNPDLGITGEKLVSGDLFGLEKYVAPNTRFGERVVSTDPERRVVIGEVCAWAEAIGARKPIVHRLASVVAELLMNALHDAPRESKPTLPTSSAAEGRRGVDVGRDSLPGGSATEGRRGVADDGKRAILRWACDANTIAISVGDAFGALRQRDVIDHVRRAKVERGRPELDAHGAGLGLYLVLANVASLVVNVDPGRRTEVVCLFDRTGIDKRAIEPRAKSLHVFT